MSLPFKIFMALFGGFMVSSLMTGPKMLSVMYRLDKNNGRTWVADKVATAYFQTIAAKDGKPPEEAACRRTVISLFLEDVRRVRWTWNGELEWKETKAEQDYSPHE